MPPPLQLALLAALCYVTGCVPSGLLVARLYGVDLLKAGSGKTGTANTMNSVGIAGAILVFAMDLAKGVAAVLLAYALQWPSTEWLAVAVGVAGAAAIVGHNWSAWVRLVSGRWGGGRGIVTALGAFVMLHPFVVLAAVLGGLGAIVLTRYMAIGAIVGTLAGMMAAVLLGAAGALSLWLVPSSFVWGVLVLVGFGDNLRRLALGTEPRLGQRVRGPDR